MRKDIQFFLIFPCKKRPRAILFLRRFWPHFDWLWPCHNDWSSGLADVYPSILRPPHPCKPAILCCWSFHWSRRLDMIYTSSKIYLVTPLQTIYTTLRNMYKSLRPFKIPIIWPPLDEIPGIPTVCDVALALYSKLLPDRVQGAGQVTSVSHLNCDLVIGCPHAFASIQARNIWVKVKLKVQAFRRLVSQLALLLGPLWAPATLNNPMLMLAVPLGCYLDTFISYHIRFSTWS